MAKTHVHGLVVGYRSEDQRRYRMQPRADIDGGRCVSCRCVVFVNANGVSALRERDADVICAGCDQREGVSVDHSMIES